MPEYYVDLRYDRIPVYKFSKVFGLRFRINVRRSHLITQGFDDVPGGIFGYMAPSRETGVHLNAGLEQEVSNDN